MVGRLSTMTALSALLLALGASPAKAESYAILMSLTPEQRHHQNNIVQALDVLTKNGYEPCNIYTVSGDIGRNDACQEDTQLEPRLQAVQQGLKNIAQRVTSDDILLFYLTGHGASEGIISEKDETLVTYRRILQEIELLDAKRTIIIADTCFGGALAEEARKRKEKNIVVVASNRPSEAGVCGYFVGSFWKAFLPDNLETDFDANGIVSLGEAFSRAKFKSYLMDVAQYEESTAESYATIAIKNDGYFGLHNLRDIDDLLYRDVIYAPSDWGDITLSGEIVTYDVHPVSTALELTAADYKSETNKDLVFLHVYTTWCNWCEVLEEQLLPLEEKYQGKVKFVKADFEAEGMEAMLERSLGQEINGFPRSFVLRDGKVLEVIKGSRDTVVLDEIIGSYVSVENGKEH